MGVRFASKKCWTESGFKRACQHLSLFVALTLYTVMGGLIFRSLEHSAERTRMKRYQIQLLTTRTNFVHRATNSSDEDFISVELMEYEKMLQTSGKNGILVYSGQDRIQWTVLQAIFFASCVLTTIGYGDIVPATTEGKAFCIVFALIGIPLTLTVIADLGKIFATPITAFVKKLPPLPTKLSRFLAPRRKSAYALLSVCFLFVYLAAGAGLFIIWEEWTFFDGFYFCFVTMTTIGFGDLVPKEPKYMLFCTVYILAGLAVTSTIIELVRRQYAQSWRQLRALRGPLAENFRRLANTHGVDILTLLTYQDINKLLTVMSMPRMSIRRKSTKEKKWQEVIEAVIKEIAAQHPTAPVLTPTIVIFESSL